MGMALFGEGSSDFANLGASIQTLFAIVNGDNITVYVPPSNLSFSLSLSLSLSHSLSLSLSLSHSLTLSFGE